MTGAGDQVIGQRGHVLAAVEGKGAIELVGENSYRMSDTAAAARAEPVNAGASEVNAFGAQRDRLRDVAAATDAAVHENGSATCDRTRNFGEDVDCADRAIELPAAMIRDHDAVDARRDGALGVVGP